MDNGEQQLDGVKSLLLLRQQVELLRLVKAIKTEEMELQNNSKANII